MKKTLLITFDYPPVRGGISHSLWQFHKQFPQDKIIVLTCTTSKDFKAEHKIYRKELISKKLIWPKWYKLLIHAWKIIKKENIQILEIGQVLPIGTVAWILNKMIKIPYIVYFYGLEISIARNNIRKTFLLKKILNNATGIITCSEYTKKQVEDFDIISSKVTVAYPCINTNITESSHEVINNFKLEKGLNNKKIILSVGNIVKRKGQDKVIEALPEITAKIPNVIYLIVGNGPYKKHLQQMAIQLHLRKYIKLFDNVSNSELPNYYQACDVFIMPSRELRNKNNKVIDVEGFGIVFLEANLYAKPVIGGRSGGVPEAVEHNVSGLLIDPENKHDIAQAVIALLNNKELANKLGQQGRQRVIEKFNSKREAEKIKHLLQ